MTSWTSVSKNGRRSGSRNPGRLPTTMPMTIAAVSPLSSRSASQTATTPMTDPNWASVPSTPGGAQRPQQHPQHGARRAGRRAARRRCCRGSDRAAPRSRSSRLAVTALKTIAPRVAPIGSISDPSQVSTRRRRSPGRMKSSSGPTTVGPETTRIAPSISAADCDRSSSSAAAPAPITHVSSVPMVTSRITVPRAGPFSRRRSRSSPASYRMTATDSATNGSNAGPSSFCGSAVASVAPSANPAGSSSTIAGMRSRVATIWANIARTTIAPTPRKMSSALIRPTARARCRRSPAPPGPGRRSPGDPG